MLPSAEGKSRWTSSQSSIVKNYDVSPCSPSSNRPPLMNEQRTLAILIFAPTSHSTVVQLLTVVAEQVVWAIMRCHWRLRASGIFPVTDPPTWSMKLQMLSHKRDAGRFSQHTHVFTRDYGQIDQQNLFVPHFSFQDSPRSISA